VTQRFFAMPVSGHAHSYSGDLRTNVDFYQCEISALPMAEARARIGKPDAVLIQIGSATIITDARAARVISQYLDEAIRMAELTKEEHDARIRWDLEKQLG